MSAAAEHEAAIAQLLAELGDTADAVADKLRAKGIKGERHEPNCCPIAHLLEAEGYENPRVDDTTVEVYTGGEWPEVTTPAPIAQFISSFDRGVYLDLVEAAE